MIKAWHILDYDMEAFSGYEGPWKIGEERSLDSAEEVQLCWKGYHSSPAPADALSYAETGRYMCQVLVSTPVRSMGWEPGDDKQVSRTRKLIDAIDLDKLAAAAREEQGTERFLLPQLNEQADEVLANLQQGNGIDPAGIARGGLNRLIAELAGLVNEIDDAERCGDDYNLFAEGRAEFNKLVKAAFARPDRKFHVKTDRHGNVQ